MVDFNNANQFDWYGISKPFVKCLTHSKFVVFPKSNTQNKMDKSFKFFLPSPNFDKISQDICKSKPHYLTPSGMSLLPREKQPPPMYGIQGATLPARYLKQQVLKEQQFAASTAVNPPEKQYCEPCELELHSLEDLKRHRAQHEECPVAGCHYKGHPTVMDKHINSLHSSGLFDKFRKLSTPEEIAAWREERRKRYPTLANVLLKQKAKEQRQRRGERLETSKNRFGNVNDRKRAQAVQANGTVHKNCNKVNNGNKINRKNKQKQFKNKELEPKVQNEKRRNEELEEKDELSCLGIQMFAGTSQLENYNHYNTKKRAVTNNALYGLVGMYGSDDDDQESEENDSDNEDNVKNINTAKETKINESNWDMTAEKSFEQYKSVETASTDNENIKIHENSLNNENTEFLKSCITSDGIEKTEFPVDHIANFDAFPVQKSVDSVMIENGTSCKNDDSSDEAPEETPIQRSNPDYSLISVKSQKTKQLSEPEAKCSKTIDRNTMPKQKIVKRKSGLDYRKARLRKQNTMLEKLLESDIRHERNILLQCVRLVCENNFFNNRENKTKHSI